MSDEQLMNCTEPETGWRIHEYELGTLSSDDAERFEEHILHCAYCRHQLEVTMDSMKEVAEHRAAVNALLRKRALDFESQLSHTGASAGYGETFRALFSSAYVRYVIPAVALAAVAGVFVLRNPVEQQHLVLPFNASRLHSDSAQVAQPNQMELKTLREDSTLSMQSSILEKTPVAEVPSATKLRVSQEETAARMTLSEKGVREPAEESSAPFVSANPFRDLLTRDPLEWKVPGSGSEEQDARAYSIQTEKSEASLTTIERLAGEAYLGRTYGVAANYFGELARLSSSKARYLLMKGVSEYMHRVYPVAAITLQKVDSLTVNAEERTHARWYLANAALAMNDPERADSLLDWQVHNATAYKQLALELQRSIQLRLSEPR